MQGKLKQKQPRKHPVLKMAALLLVASLMLTWGTGVVPAVVVEASTKQELQAAKDQQAAIAAEKARLAKQNEALSNKVDDLSGDLAWLNTRSAEQQALYEEKSLQLEAAYTAMEDAYNAYLESEAVLANKQAQYTERVQIMFDHQNRSLFEVFLESKSLQGFFTTIQFMEIVADTDEQMIEELQAAKDNAALQRDTAKQQQVDMQAVVTQLEADLAELKADAEAAKEDLDATKLQLSEQEIAEDELSNESARIAAQVANLSSKLDAENAAATLAAQIAAGVSASGWTWPYPGDKNIYSAYGWRMHPVYHYNRFHSGVDLGGDFGNPIVAARAGTVYSVIAPRQGSNTGGSGYGNYVIINHGDGYCTLYAHMKQTLVTVGQVVNAGDVIGLCGSTGTSTGAHVHFEIMLDGATVDPAKYIK